MPIQNARSVFLITFALPKVFSPKGFTCAEQSKHLHLVVQSRMLAPQQGRRL